MKVLLVNPPATESMARVKDKGMYPYSLLFVSNYLRKNSDYRADVLDLCATQDCREGLVDWLRTRRYDMIGFTATTHNRFLVWDLVCAAKQTLPGSLVVVGGKHFTYTAQETLECIPEIDVVVRGEGEKTFLELVDCCSHGADFAQVDGISYRLNQAIHHNKERDPIHDLDEVVVDDDAIDDLHFPNGVYSPTFNLSNFREEHKPSLSIHVGRGCPGRCTFCNYNKTTYRTRSVDSVVKEIVHKKNKYGISCFHLDDPHLLKRQAFIKEICQRLIDEKINIEWYAETRADINPDILELMKTAGLVSVDLGLESASPKVLRAIKKDIQPEQVSRVLQKCHQLGVRVLVFTMISLPDEEVEDVRMTYDFILKQEKYITTIQQAQVTLIYPGTELEKMARERGVITPTFSWYDRSYRIESPIHGVGDVPLWIEKLSPAQIQYYYQKIYDLYRKKLSFNYFLRYLKVKIRSILFDWSRTGIKYKYDASKYFLRWVYVRMKGALSA